MLNFAQDAEATEAAALHCLNAGGDGVDSRDTRRRLAAIHADNQRVIKDTRRLEGSANLSMEVADVWIAQAVSGVKRMVTPCARGACWFMSDLASLGPFLLKRVLELAAPRESEKFRNSYRYKSTYTQYQSNVVETACACHIICFTHTLPPIYMYVYLHILRVFKHCTCSRHRCDHRHACLWLSLVLFSFISAIHYLI